MHSKEVNAGMSSLHFNHCASFIQPLTDKGTYKDYRGMCSLKLGGS